MTGSLDLPGYRVHDRSLYLSHSTRIYKGVNEEGQEVIVKCSALAPSPRIKERLSLEYKLASQLNKEPSSVQALACLDYKYSYALIFEYSPLPSLKTLLAEHKKLPLADCLILALNMAKALQSIHDGDIIHKDINPSNILCDLNTKAVKIIDFGSAINLPKEYASLSVKHLEGTLAYMAPEQSGRMNRGIDYRCDHYSLGITLYQMLTGSLPFQGQDVLEMIYQHMAVMPKSPHELDPGIPEAVSDVVMKLMMKTCEERYQSLYGLIYDLKQCQTQLEQKGRIDSFPIAAKDRYHRFQIPEKLYGREGEMETLMQAYKTSIQGKASLMMVAGQAGIGKTALVHEIYKPIIRERGYFISGKFEQFERHIPFSALGQAFDALVEQIASEEDRVVQRYKEAILTAVEGKGQLLIDIIPNLKIILGSQPEVPPIPVDQTKARLHYVFNQFLHALNWIEHPLVIFLDDVQWIDDASLGLLKELLSEEEEEQYLFFITAYRSNEVDSNHPFMKAVEDLKHKNITVHDIVLNPLGVDSVQALLADSLYQSQEQVAELAQICYSKTAGNPFFLNQVLLTLVQEQLIAFNSKNNLWSWQLEKIKSTYVSSNVVDLLTKKMRSLSEQTQTLLQNAACIGTQFDLNLLTELTQYPSQSLAPLLEEAQRGGFIDRQEQTGWQFAHDRIQQAALTAMPEEAQKKAHLKLARFLLEKTPEKNLDRLIFTLLEHYNNALSLVCDASEKETLIQLNLRAAKQSKLSGAYRATLSFIENALLCVSEDLWNTNYALMFEVHLEATEAAYLSSHYDQVESYAALSLKQAQTKIDKLKIMCIQSKTYAGQLNTEKTMGVLREALSSMGIAFPKKVRLYHVIMALIKTHLYLTKKNIQKFSEQKKVQDAEQQALMLVTAPASHLAFRTAPDIYALLTCITALYCMKNNYIGGDLTCEPLSILEVGIFNAIPKALALFEAIQQHTKHFTEEEKADNLMIQGIFLHHKKPLQYIVAQLQTAFKLAYSSGAFFTAAEAAALDSSYSLTIEPLQDVKARLIHYLALLRKTKQLYGEGALIIALAGIQRIQVKTEDPCNFSSKDFDETAVLQKYRAEKDMNSLAAFYYAKLMVGLILELYPRAWEYSLHLESCQQGVLATYLIPRFLFYQALSAFQLLKSRFSFSYRRRINRTIKRIEGWTQYCPEIP